MRVYPLVKLQIYIFHLNKNAALHIKQKWNKAVIAAVINVIGLPPSQNEADNGDDLNYAQEQRVINCGGRPLYSKLRVVLEAVEYLMNDIYKLQEAVIYTYTVEDFHVTWSKLKAFFSL